MSGSKPTSPAVSPAVSPARPRTVGVEEEFFLVDPASRRSAPWPQLALTERATGVAHRRLGPEFFRHQLEARTDPCRELCALKGELLENRRAVADVAASAGLIAIASATLPLGGGEATVSPVDRYLAMVDVFGDVSRSGETCGMHVHVAIDSPEQGVAVIDRITPWLPLVLAIAANSPYVDAGDTGYASWRARMWAQWPSAGPTERFGSLAGYREAAGRLLASGAALDEGMLYFDARLSVAHPTVEVRVADVCTDPDDAVLVAALVRALVEGAAREQVAAEVCWPTGLLRAAQWRAARYAVSEALLDPVTGELRPACDVLASTVALLREPLDDAGDLALVESGLERVLAGTGSDRQRAAYERTGSLEAVVDDLEARTHAAWRVAAGPAA